MADELSIGILGGIPLEMEMLDDSFESAVARYDYPFADGADLEDMGQRAHMIRMRAYFYDNAEKEAYDDHIALISLLSDRGLVDFEHPKYGLMKGKIEELNVRHDDRQRCAEVDITFVEQMRQTIEPRTRPAVLSTVEEAYIAGQEEQIAALREDLLGAIPVTDAAALTQILDASATMLSQVQGFSADCRNVVGAVETLLGTAEATVADVTSPVDSLQSTLTYALTIPGRIIGSLAAALEKTARLCDSLRNYPARYVQNLDLAMTDLEDVIADLADSLTGSAATAGGGVMTSHLRIACAQRMALEAAQVIEEDQAAFTDPDDADDYEVLTLPELEQTLAVVRRRLDEAVEAAREMGSLKIMAVALLDHVNAVRLEREKMEAVILDNPIPLHLVCLRQGLPYTYAERLLKVNRSIRNPNFTSGEVLVYVR
jgi:prophage DNA circulation protein